MKRVFFEGASINKDETANKRRTKALDREASPTWGVSLKPESDETINPTKKDSTELLKFANTSRLAGRYNDVTVCVGNDRFPANRMVLASASNYFENVFEKNKGGEYPDHVEVEGVDKASMEALIEFIYTGSVTVSDENAFDLLSAATLLHIKEVKEKCSKFLNGKITVENCCHFLEIADKYKVESLEAKSVRLMGQRLNEVSDTKAFKSQSKTSLMNCLQKLDRTSVDEASLYKALVEWTKYDETNRVVEFPGLFKLIFDFQNLPDEVIEVGLEEALVKQHVELRKMIRNARNKRKKIKLTRTKSQEEYKGSKILSLGGYFTPLDVIEVYNCNNERPALYPSLPDFGRYGGAAAVLDDCLYYVGGTFKVDGIEETISKVLWHLKYRTRSSEWECMDTSMSIARCNMGGTAFDEKLVVNGGTSDEGKTLSSGESYSPTENSWETVAPLRQARSNHALVVCRGSLYAIGGVDGDGKQLSSVERLEADGSAWKFVKQMDIGRSDFAAVCYNDCIYVIGGIATDGEVLKSVEEYNPGNNIWEPFDAMNFQRFGCSACVLQGRVYVVGGSGRGQTVKEIECYDPNGLIAGGWKYFENVEERLEFHSMVVV